jgi:hypothetical protein
MRRGQQPLHAGDRAFPLGHLPLQAVVIDQDPDDLNAWL